MTLTEARDLMFSKIKDNWVESDAVIHWEGQVLDPDLTKNYMKVSSEFIASPRQSVGSSFSERTTVAVVCNLFTLVNGQDKSLLIEKLLDILKVGFGIELEVDNNPAISYFSAESKHEKTRIIVFASFFNNRILSS